MRILSAQDVDNALRHVAVEDLIQSQRKVFAAYTKRDSIDVQSPLRTTIWTPDTKFLFMPARITAAGGTAAKIVSRPLSGERPLSAITVVMDEDTATIGGIVNSTRLTALRNACASVLAIQCFKATRPQRNLVIFGSGAQAECHATLFLKVLPSIHQCTFIVRRLTAKLDQMLRTICAEFSNVRIDCEISTYPDSIATDLVATLIKAADIIVTTTPSLQPLFDTSDVSAGTHILLIGSCRPDMHEADGRLLHRAGIVVVDSKDACLHESGEIIDAGISAENLCELGDLVGEGLEARHMQERIAAAGDLNVFKSVGIGLQDVSIASLMLSTAEMLGLGVVVDV